MIWLSLALAGPVGEGAAALESGDIQAAIELWEPAVQEGWGSGRIKYNLGNAYFKRGDLPRAIAYWRAAGDLQPRSSAIAHNLALARGQLERVPTPAAGTSFWMRLCTPGELGLVGSLLVLIASGGLVVRARRREGSRIPWVLLGLLGWAAGVLSFMGWWAQAQRAVAVVVDAPAQVRDAPDLTASIVQQLQPGAELGVVREAGGFVLVETGDGDRGWVTDGAVFRVPR